MLNSSFYIFIFKRVIPDVVIMLKPVKEKTAFAKP